MPLINTNLINDVLVEAGIAPAADAKLTDLLRRNNLDVHSLLSALNDIAVNAPSDAIRLRAIEDALKMHGAMKEAEVKPSFSFNISITDKFAPEMQVTELPFIIPREVSN
jgi:hypothetical protein